MHSCWLVGFENGATVKQIQVFRAELEPGPPDYKFDALSTRALESTVVRFYFALPVYLLL